MRRSSRSRAGITCLEVQVSLVVLGIALAGICPMMVMQMKLLRRIESTQIGTANYQVIRGQRIVDGDVYIPEGDAGTAPVAVLQPAANNWARRLGVAAPFQDRVYSPSYAPILSEMTIDDGAAVYTGTWSDLADAETEAGTAHTLASGNDDKTATWTFSSIVEGRYRVMISWPSSVIIPPDAKFTIVDASSTEIPVMVSATTQIDGGPWRDLGNFSLATTATIRLNGSSFGAVVADAVRIGQRNNVTLTTAEVESADNGMARRVQVVRRP